MDDKSCRSYGVTSNRDYVCATRTLNVTNINSNGGPEVAFIWARVDPGTTPTPTANRHPHEHGAIKKPVDPATASATITKSTWPNSGTFTVHVWYDFGFEVVSSPPAACPVVGGSSTSDANSSDGSSASEG